MRKKRVGSSSHSSEDSERDSRYSPPFAWTRLYWLAPSIHAMSSIGSANMRRRTRIVIWSGNREPASAAAGAGPRIAAAVPAISSASSAMRRSARRRRARARLVTRRSRCTGFTRQSTASSSNAGRVRSGCAVIATRQGASAVRRASMPAAPCRSTSSSTSSGRSASMQRAAWGTVDASPSTSTGSMDSSSARNRRRVISSPSTMTMRSLFVPFVAIGARLPRIPAVPQHERRDLVAPFPRRVRIHCELSLRAGDAAFPARLRRHRFPLAKGGIPPPSDSRAALTPAQRAFVRSQRLLRIA